MGQESKGTTLETVEDREKEIEEEGFKSTGFDENMLGLGLPKDRKIEDGTSLEKPKAKNIKEDPAGDAPEEEEQTPNEGDEEGDEDEPKQQSIEDMLNDILEEGKDEPEKAAADPTAAAIERLQQQLNEERKSRESVTAQLLTILTDKIKGGDTTEPEKSKPIFTKEEIEEANGDADKLAQLLTSKIEKVVEERGQSAIQKLLDQEKTREEEAKAATQVGIAFYKKYPKLMPFAQLVAPIAQEVLTKAEWNHTKDASIYFAEIQERVKEQLRALQKHMGTAKGSGGSRGKTGQPDGGPSSSPKGGSRAPKKGTSPTNAGLDDVFESMLGKRDNSAFTGR